MEDTEREAVAVGGDARGKHRILAELGRVEQEVRSLEVTSLSSLSATISMYVSTF